MPEKVQVSKFTYAQLQSSRRMLTGLRNANHRVLRRVLLTLETEEEVASSTITFTILAEPTSAVYPPPVELAKKLNWPSKKSKLLETFGNFDSTYNIEPIEFKRYDVGFSTNPTILNVSFEEVNVTCNLDNYGYVYAVAVRKDDDLGKPSSFQIANGLSYQNIPIPSGYAEIDEKFTIFNLTVSYLDSDTDYNLYMSAGSAHPGYPDYMNDTQVIFLEFKTPKEPESRLILIARTEIKY